MIRPGLAVIVAGLLTVGSAWEGIAAETASRGQTAGQPESAAALLGAAKLAVEGGRYAEAIRLLEGAVARAPREADYHHWLGNACAWAAATAELCDKPALGRKCLAAYQRAIELDPDSLPARFGLMNFYRHVPRLFGGGMARARAEAQEIERRDPVAGAYARAVLHAHEKNHAAAFAALDEVRRENPTHYSALCLTGRVALASGERLEEGAAALRRCLELTPTDLDESHESVARCLAELTALKSSQQIASRGR